MLSVIFLASLIAGLLLGVRAMLVGVERRDTGDAAPRTALSLPSVAVFAAAFGLVGYLALRYAALTPLVAALVAIVAGGLAVAGFVALVAKWAVPSAAAEPEDERYLLQGTPAHVTQAIDAEHDGEVGYAVDGVQHATLARSFDGTPHELGADVVIDRIEDGVAYVEAWAVVEQRI